MSNIRENADKILGFDQKKLGDQVVSPLTGKTYELKFIDDFEGNAINDAYWTHDPHNSNSAYMQAYLPENIVVKDSLLHLIGKKEKAMGEPDCDGNCKEVDYSSGKIISKGKMEFQYGRFEMYGKLPKGQGMWPAFWTLGATKAWPWGGEIDIMEMVGGDDQWGNLNRDAQNIWSLHYTAPEVPKEDAWGTGKSTKHIGFCTHDVPGREEGHYLGEEYHLYGAEWTPEKIIAYFDGEKVGEIEITAPAMREAFHNPHYMLLNLTIGGTWALGFDWDGAYVHDETLPQELIVDWVKVWQEVPAK